MLCPKCGGENPGNAHVCEACSTALIKAMTSKLAIVSLVLGILSLFFFILTGIPAIVVGIISLLKIRRSNGALKKGKYIALAGMNVSIVFMCIFYILWSRDAPPIPNDYTIADLRSAPAEYAESYELLKMLIDEDHNVPGAPAIGLSDGDIDMIADIRDVVENGTEAEVAQVLKHDANDIKAAWASSQKARNIIRRLNQFPEIADLAEPGYNFRIMRYTNLVELVRLFQVYAYLQTDPDHIHAFTIELIELDSVSRKLSLNARLFIERFICHLCLETTIKASNAIVNHPKTSKNTIELLATHFTLLNEEQLSLRNSVLFEYLLIKNAVLNNSGVSLTGKIPLLKRHSTLRLYKNRCDDCLNAMEQTGNTTTERLSVWPVHYPFKETDPFRNGKLLLLIYRGYNPLGSTGIQGMRFFSNINQKKGFRLLVRNDLLQVVLNKRLGKNVSTKARAYGDEYIIDVKNKKIFSPGPDGKVGTKDDIELRINPKVLGWGN